MPHYYRWIKTNGSHLPHLSAAIKHLQEPHGMLILGSSGSRHASKLLSDGKNLKELFPGFEEHESKKDQVLFFRELNGKVTTFDLTSLNVSSHNDEPLFSFTPLGSKGNSMNRLHVGTITGNLYRYQPITKQTELQTTKLTEFKDQFIFLSEQE
jgi:hypothetical protein